MIPIPDVVRLEGILAPHPSLMEESQRNDSLRNTNTLTTEHATKSKLRRVTCHLLARFHDTNRLALDGTCLHDNFKTAERVRDKHIDRTDDSRCHQARGRPPKRGFVPKLLLDVLLQARLSDEAQSGRGERVPHQWYGPSEQGSEALSCRLAENFQDGLDSARLLEVRPLLLLNHADGIDEWCREDGGASCGNHSRVLTLLHEEGYTEKDAELGNALESDPDQPRSDARHGG
mmetsp:Transcript_46933/g.87138  ORF Transcript_46933/g.87138 Transcript_46933/m.87138 type:complete len:232 (+) Transcript_46933:269-964(+)